MEEELLSKLTFPFRVKTIKIIELKDKIVNYKYSYKYICISIIVMLFTFTIFCYNINVYQNFLMQIGERFANFSYTLPTLNKIYSYILVILFSSLIATVYFYTKEVSKKRQLIDNYKNLRINIIESIEDEFCKHEQSCNCKEEYYEFMDSKNIDLVFK